MLIQNGRLLNPADGTDGLFDLRIADGKVAEIGKLKPIDGEEIIDASGCIVSPGFVDVHVHFRDPGLTYKEDLETGSRAAAAGGVTSVVLMANTKPIIDDPTHVKKLVDRFPSLPIHAHTIAAVTKGFQSEELTDLEGLLDAGAVGFSDDGMPINNTKLLVEAMERSAKLGVPISFHEEDPNLIGTPGVNDGEVSQKMGYRGASALAETVMVARDLEIARETDAIIDIQHVSAAGTVDLIREAKAKGVKAHGEVTPHHFTLTEEAVLTHGSMAKMNPPLRTEADRQALLKGLQDGTLDLIVTDHAPHADEEKARVFDKCPSGILGLETMLSLGIEVLVDGGVIPLMQLIEKMTINPARLYGLEAGDLCVGKPADIAIFDPEAKWIYGESLSKSNNSPFLGREMKGLVKVTICSGKVVYDNRT